MVRGKLGRTKKAAKAMAIVMEPSMMKSHRLRKKFSASVKSVHEHHKSTELAKGVAAYHARSPLLPSKPVTMPAAIRPEKAPEINDPEYNMAVRNAISFLVYHEDRKNRHPGYIISVSRTSVEIRL